MRILTITAKCSDAFGMTLAGDGKGNQDYNGYVPAWFPNPTEDHYGDYVQLTINLETGQIVNWKKPSAKQLEATFKEKS